MTSILESYTDEPNNNIMYVIYQRTAMRSTIQSKFVAQIWKAGLSHS